MAFSGNFLSSKLKHGMTAANNSRSLIYVAVFGTLWGLVEATLGNFLHMLRLPFAGSILSAIGLIIILTARAYNNKRGSTILIALVAAFVKVMSFTTVKLGPFVGILMEGALVEFIFLLISVTRFSFLLAGITIGLYPLLHNLFTKTVLFGLDFLPVIIEMVNGISDRFGFDLGWWLVGLYVSIHFTFGLGAAMIAWRLRFRIQIILDGISA